MKNKSKIVYVTHRIKSDSIDKLNKLSHLTGKTSAELLEDMIEEMYDNMSSRDMVEDVIIEDKMNDKFSESLFGQEYIDAERRWKDSKKGLNEFIRKVEDWKKEENRKNTKQAEAYKKKIDDWARAWEQHFRDYTSSIRKNKTHHFKYFNPNDGAKVWKKQMREYTKEWHPDYAPNDGDPKKFGEMKAEYDILTGKTTKEYSL